MKKDNSSVLEREVAFMMNIHQGTDDKLNELFEAIGERFEDVATYDALERITFAVMKKIKKSDRHFLLWLHVVGQHIKLKYDGYWVIIKHGDKSSGEYYFPAIMNANTEIWRVGNSCYKLYYTKRRMYDMSFDTFYKLHIERAIAEYKFSDLNIPESDLIILEQ